MSVVVLSPGNVPPVPSARRPCCAYATAGSITPASECPCRLRRQNLRRTRPRSGRCRWKRTCTFRVTIPMDAIPSFISDSLLALTLTLILNLVATALPLCYVILLPVTRFCLSKPHLKKRCPSE